MEEKDKRKLNQNENDLVSGGFDAPGLPNGGGGKKHTY